MSNKEMKTKTIRTIKNTIYTEIDDSIWLYNFVSGAKLRKMCEIPLELKGKFRDEFINEMITFYNNN